MIDGVANFADAWEKRKVIEIEGIPVFVLGRAHLKQNKRATGRPQDQADLAWLEEAEN